MRALWYEASSLSYNTRSIRSYVNHNDLYGPFIFLVVEKSASSLWECCEAATSDGGRDLAVRLLVLSDIVEDVVI